MLSYDEAFYLLYKNTNKELQLVDRLGNTATYTLKENEHGRSYYPVAGGNPINYDYVAWTNTELKQSEYATHRIADAYLAESKQSALDENIRTELLSNINAYARYFDYYKDSTTVFTIYALANYDVRQENRSCILARFNPRNELLDDTKEHRLIGIAPTAIDYGTRVITVTNEAWRFDPLPWSKIREICPEFVQIVLDGQEP